jgi:hypothetical protein
LFVCYLKGKSHFDLQQMEAVMALERFATPATRLALTDIIENENCFYKVRCDAAYCLAKVSFLIDAQFLYLECSNLNLFWLVCW